ncbi:MAG TPA: hypothetical protein VD836_00395 [Solirubrobacteraceae bacterium]|nr:hypothetical protein [Solirubrobacteraceae bacterium]
MIHRKLLLIPALVATAAVAAPAATAHAAAPRITDIDAELTRDGRVELDVETTRASRVELTYRGRTITLRKGEWDRDDRTRDWYRTVRARGGDAGGNVRVTLKVRACLDGDCTTRSAAEFLEREDGD